MYPLGSFAIRSVCFFCRGIRTKVYHFLVCGYLGFIRPVAHPRMIVNALKSCLISVWGIGLVLAVCRDAQITKNIVALVSINMVNLFRRPLAHLVEPSEPMREVRTTAEFDNDVPLLINIARFCTYANFGAWNSPVKLPSPWDVAQYAKKLFVCHGGTLAFYPRVARD